MKIRFTKDVLTPDPVTRRSCVTYKADQIIETSDAVAALWIDKKVAVPAVDSAPVTAPPVVETAAEGEAASKTAEEPAAAAQPFVRSPRGR